MTTKRKNGRKRKTKENDCIQIFNLLAETRITIAELCEAERDDENWNHSIFPILFCNVLLILVYIRYSFICWKLRLVSATSGYMSTKEDKKWNENSVAIAFNGKMNWEIEKEENNNKIYTKKWYERNCQHHHTFILFCFWQRYFCV